MQTKNKVWIGTSFYAIVISILMFAALKAEAEFEYIKEWKEPLVCWPIKGDGTYGAPIELLWDNFLTFDESSRMVFLKLNKGLHTVPTKGFVCLPKSMKVE